jgi:hypothetical protein
MMSACSGGLSRLGCFAQMTGAGCDVFPDSAATTYGARWGRDFPEAKFRVLREIPFRTAFWMRSSADGRFFANGVRSAEDDAARNSDADVDEGGMISDLQNQLTDGAGYRDIAVRAAYDPSFFPDNSGFMFQGTDVGAGFCRQSILENLATSRIVFNEPECSGSEEIELYQAVGASLDGSDYLAIAGSYESDRGNGRDSGDNVPSWFERSYLQLTPIIDDGQHFKTMGVVEKWIPFLGDWGLSPSNLMTASRVSGVDASGEPKQMGIKFHLVQKIRNDQGYDFELKEVGTVCAKGNKGAFSFDERFFATYHYVDADDWQELGYARADDPEFQALLRAGSANVYVVDLMTGASRRITHMGAGQYALFPHYRADGWLYFLAVDKTINKRFIMATDGSLRLAGNGITH